MAASIVKTLAALESCAVGESAWVWLGTTDAEGTESLFAGPLRGDPDGQRFRREVRPCAHAPGTFGMLEFGPDGRALLRAGMQRANGIELLDLLGNWAVEQGQHHSAPLRLLGAGFVETVQQPQMLIGPRLDGFWGATAELLGVSHMIAPARAVADTLRRARQGDVLWFQMLLNSRNGAIVMLRRPNDDDQVSDFATDQLRLAGEVDGTPRWVVLPATVDADGELVIVAKPDSPNIGRRLIKWFHRWSQQVPELARLSRITLQTRKGTKVAGTEVLELIPAECGRRVSPRADMLDDLADTLDAATGPLRMWFCGDDGRGSSAMMVGPTDSSDWLAEKQRTLLAGPPPDKRVIKGRLKQKGDTLMVDAKAPKPAQAALERFVSEAGDVVPALAGTTVRWKTS